MASEQVTVEVLAEGQRSGVRRNVLSPHALTTQPDSGVATVLDIVRLAADNTARALGARRVVATVVESRDAPPDANANANANADADADAPAPRPPARAWSFFTLSPFEWLSYKQVAALAFAYGAGLRALGLLPTQRLSLFADTSRDWLIMALAASTQNITITTAYATLGEDGLAYSLEECEVSTIFTNAHLLPIVAKVVSSVKRLQNVIYTGVASEEQLRLFKDIRSSLKIVSLDELLAL
ncbi:long-chain fatty acid-CoA ligase, partial [Physocladia obscura]